MAALLAGGRALAAEYFRRRRAPLAFCELYAELHDALLARALELSEGKPSGDFVVLATGPRGRGEQTLFARSGYLLLSEEEPSPPSAALLAKSALAPSVHFLWHGSAKKWRHALQDGAFTGGGRGESLTRPDKKGEEDSDVGAPLSDLMVVTGNGAMGARVVAEAWRAVEADAHAFPLLARRAASLPVALNIFGRLRPERAGTGKGVINLREGALLPLRESVHALSLIAGVRTAGTAARIRELTRRGELGQALARELWDAYLLFMELVIEAEINGEEKGWLWQPHLAEEGRGKRVKKGLHAVLTLQKVLHRRAVGRG